MNPVVVVESIGKQRVFADLLRKSALDGWTVVSCSGHYCGLPKSSLGIDPKTLEFTWKIRNFPALGALKKAMADANLVYAATDSSMEGEALAHQVSITAGYANKPFHRLRLSSLDVDSLKSAVASPSALDMKLLNGFLAREAADRISHHILSPVLSSRLGEGLAFNRVALPVLSELARLERKLRRHRPAPHWVVRVLLSDGAIAESSPLTTESQANEIVRRAKAAVPAFSRTTEFSPPLPPFTFSSLAQFMAAHYGLDVLTCAQACESLFALGLITYPYTDDCSLPAAAAQEVCTYISDCLSPDLLGKEPVTYGSSSYVGAIRPLQISASPSLLDLTGDMRKVYAAIWFRVMGSQGRASQLERQQARYFLDDEEVFKAEGVAILISNWHQLSGRLFEPVIRPLSPDATVEDATALVLNSKPPRRHTHGSLVEWLDSNLLGNPSTYRSVLEFLRDNSYAETLGGGLLRLTSRGEAVVTFVRRAVKDLVTSEFCAEVEEELSAVASGKLDFETFVREYWQHMNEISSQMSKKSLRPEFSSPEGHRLRVMVDKETGRPYVRAQGEDWWSYVAFDSKGKITLDSTP